jgi:hypothetical protein
MIQSVAHPTSVISDLDRQSALSARIAAKGFSPRSVKFAAWKWRMPAV